MTTIKQSLHLSILKKLANWWLVVGDLDEIEVAEGDNSDSDKDMETDEEE